MKQRSRTILLSVLLMLVLDENGRMERFNNDLVIRYLDRTNEGKAENGAPHIKT